MKSSLTPRGMDSRTWNGVDIQRRPSDGYVNATAMCKAYGRQWSHYLENARTAQYLQALSRSLGIPRDLLILSITTGLNELRGTWVHPRIAVDLARWLHPEFAVWMDGWFLEGVTPKFAADPTPAPTALPRGQREKLTFEVGGPGVNVPGAAAFSAQLTEILDTYVTKTEAEQQALPQIERKRSLVQPRYAAKHFLEWFVAEHGQLVISPVPVGIPIAAVAAPPAPVPAPQPRPQPDPWRQQADPEEGWEDVGPAPLHPRRPRVSQAEAKLRQYERGELITGPDLAHLLGISPNSLNHWATDHGVGAERDGWRLAGRGKLSAGRCGTYPPGCASWLFQKL
jgi:hypothetical protein